jgi:hypothetical protein
MNFACVIIFCLIMRDASALRVTPITPRRLLLIRGIFAGVLASAATRPRVRAALLQYNPFGVALVAALDVYSRRLAAATTAGACGSASPPPKPPRSYWRLA